MNQDNYATFEASNRLVHAGIVMETDAIYGARGDLLYKSLVECRIGDVPAPSMAEVWRELPEWAELIRQHKWDTVTYQNQTCQGANTIDCLIDLLIWVRADKE